MDGLVVASLTFLGSIIRYDGVWKIRVPMYFGDAAQDG